MFCSTNVMFLSNHLPGIIIFHRLLLLLLALSRKTFFFFFTVDSNYRKDTWVELLKNSAGSYISGSHRPCWGELFDDATVFESVLALKSCAANFPILTHCTHFEKGGLRRGSPCKDQVSRETGGRGFHVARALVLSLGRHWVPTQH